MTTHVVLDRALNPSFQLSINPSNQIVAIPRRKSCCTKLDQVKKEREAVEAATRWLSSHTPTDTNSYQAFRGIYKKASQHRIAIHRLTHGFIGWLKSLFRGKEKTEELRQLEASLIEMQKTMRIGNHLSRSITSQIEASDRSITSDMLFKQVEAEMPEAVVSPKAQVTAATFGITEQNSTPAMPFLIQRNQSDYNFIFPPDNYQSAPGVITRHSLLDLPLCVKIHQTFNIQRACKSFNRSLEDVRIDAYDSRYPRDVVRYLHLEFSPPTPDRTDFLLIASYRNPVNGRIETKELILDATQTEDSVKSWATELIRENQARLAEIKARIANNNPDGIQVDLQNFKYYVSIDLGEGREFFETFSLGETSFEHLKTQIASRRNEVAIRKANEEFWETQGAYTISRTVGPYKFTVDKHDRVVNGRLVYDYTIWLEATDGNIVHQELCHISDRSLEEALNETIQSYSRYYSACKDLIVNLNGLKEALSSGDNLQLGSCLLQSVALTVERGPPDLLKAHRWVPGKENFVVDELRVESTTSMEQVRNWVEGLIADTKRCYDELISPMTKDPAISNICVEAHFSSCKIKCDYKGFNFEIDFFPVISLCKDGLSSRIEQCKKNIAFSEELSKDAEGCVRIKPIKVDGKINNDWEIVIIPEKNSFRATLQHFITKDGQTVTLPIASSQAKLDGHNWSSLEELIKTLKTKAFQILDSMECKRRENEVRSTIHTLNSHFFGSEVANLCPHIQTEVIADIISSLEYENHIKAVVKAENEEKFSDKKLKTQWTKTKKPVLNEQNQIRAILSIIEKVKKFSHIIPYIDTNLCSGHYNVHNVSYEKIYLILKQLEKNGVITFTESNPDTIKLKEDWLENKKLIQEAVKKMKSLFKISDIKTACPTIPDETITFTLSILEQQYSTAASGQQCVIKKVKKTNEYKIKIID